MKDLYICSNLKEAELCDRREERSMRGTNSKDKFNSKFFSNGVCGPFKRDKYLEGKIKKRDIKEKRKLV